MIAILLAAGIGHRMRPLTDSTPKTLLRVADETLLGRIVQGLVDNRVTRLVVVTGYMADLVERHLRARFPDLGFTFVHNARYRETNNIHSLSLAMEAVDPDEDVLLIETDLVFESGVIRQILESPHPNVALVDRFRVGMDGSVVTVEGGVVTSLIPPHLQGPTFDFSDKYKTLNIYRFSREFCAAGLRNLLAYYTRILDDNAYYELLLGILIYVQKERIHAEIVRDRWAEVDDPNDLAGAEFEFHPQGRFDLLEGTFGGLWVHDMLDFCFMRNPHFPTDSMLSELRNSLPRLVQGYGSAQAVLNRKLSYLLLCRPERVHMLNGASQAFPLLRSFLAGRRALIPSPTFGEYARIFPDALRYDDDVGLDLQQVETLAADAGAVVFVNPNNPTGSAVPTRWIEDFARARPDTFVLVDESFLDYSAEPSLLPALEAGDLRNVAILKSLSKCMGVPGLRLGFLYTAHEDLGRHVADSLPIWNCNSLAEFLLEVSLKHRRSLAESFETSIREREELARGLAALPRVRHVHPSQGSFLLVEVEGSAADLCRRLLAERRIYLKDVSAKFGGRGVLRVAVRSREDNRVLVEALRDFG